VDPPTEVNPLLATSTLAGDTSVEDSYRCAVCHGFDYKGDLGFPGIADSAGKDPNQILAVLKGAQDPKHDFSAFMDDQTLTDIALFVSNEQIDVTPIVADNKPVNGNADSGKTLFTNSCIYCHGPQGMAINFQDDAGPEYIGTIANESPVEILTKLRFGQPGIPKMPSGIDNSFTNQNYADLIAYLQTLPTSSPVTEGGRLYDDWIGATGAADPTGDQPLWATQTTNTASGHDTWTCAVCHGFDYKGKDGVNASGTENYTGFPGVLDAKTKSADELKGILTGNPDPKHDFSQYLSGPEIDALVAFMQNGVTDRAPYFNADGTIKGNPAHGKTEYNSVCQICHGADGKTKNFAETDAPDPEYVGTLANDEPQTIFHVGTVGEPGANMPAGMNLGWSQQDIADLLAYLQTLPTK
jgi:mono/diheme cytochrome c family protein